MTPETLTRSIQTEALQTGFSHAGVAPASALTRRDAELRRWLGQGLGTGLPYMETFFERRSRLLNEIPWVRSILVLAAAYDATSLAPETMASGRIARYAKGRDYHRVLRKRMKTLMRNIRILAGPETRLAATIDTSAVQERTLAEAAGLGFFGKNTCLIRPKGGSYFFLAALMTDLPLVPDAPLEWDCGSCSLCLQACPTQALKEPYQLDAQRCIASLTIENRGAIPQDLRPAVADWLFGCDICQEVCPYNHAALEPKTGETASTNSLPLAEILALRTDEAFRSRFASTPLTRPKREGLLRNAAVVAGNLKESSQVPALIDLLRREPSPMVRSHAAWALGQIHTAESQSALKQAQRTEQDPDVLAEIRLALSS